MMRLFDQLTAHAFIFSTLPNPKEDGTGTFYTNSKPPDPHSGCSYDLLTQGVFMFPVCSSSQTHTSLGVSVCASVRSDRCTDGRPPSAVSPAVRQEACLPHGRGAAAGERLGSREAAQLPRAAPSPLQLLAGKISSHLTLTDALPPRFRRVQQPRGNETALLHVTF